MAYNLKDYYFQKAKTENYAARSIFKLQEIDERFKVFKQGYKVLDLGAAPGSWSQYASKKVAAKGRVLAIDLQPINLTLPNTAFVLRDIRDIHWDEILKATEITPPFDIVMSDMAPRTTGIRVTDQVRSLELCQLALATADLYLKSKGTFICKLFHSEGFEELRRAMRKRFNRVEVIRPKSTRKESKEIFLVGLQYQPELKK